MKLYNVTFNGSWLGGKAIVRASDSRQAKKLLREYVEDEHESKSYAQELLEGMSAKEIKLNDGPAVVYYDDGEY